MADDDALDELVQRVAHLEQLLTQRLARDEPGPELRSAKSIVGRLDDVEVAVREGNERLAAVLEQSGAGAAPVDLGHVEQALAEVLSRLGAGSAVPAGTRSGAEQRAARSVLGRLEEILRVVREPDGRPAAGASGANLEPVDLAGIEESLAQVLNRLGEIGDAVREGSERLDALQGPGPAPAAVDLSSTEEALAEVLRRLDLGPVQDQLADLGLRLEAAIADLGDRVDALTDLVAEGSVDAPPARRRRPPAT